MSFRTVAEHALTVYYDGNRELARKVLDGYAHELAEKQRELLFAADCDCGECKGIRMAADLIDPEVLNSE